MEKNLRFKVRGFKSFQMVLYHDRTNVNPKYYNRVCNVSMEKRANLLRRVKPVGESQRAAFEFILDRLEFTNVKLPRYEFTPNFVFSDKAHLYEELGLMTYSRKRQIVFNTCDNIVELFSLFPTTKTEALREIINERINDLDYEKYPFIPRQCALKFISRTILGDYGFEFKEFPRLNFLGELFLGINDEFDQCIERMYSSYRKGNLFLHGEFLSDVPSQYDLRSLFIYILCNDMQNLIHARLLQLFESSSSFVVTSKASGVTVVQSLRDDVKEFPIITVQGYCDQAVLELKPIVSTGVEVLQDYLDYYSMVYDELGLLEDINQIQSNYQTLSP